MAEPDYGGSVWAPLPRDPPSQGPELSAPHLAAHPPLYPHALPVTAYDLTFSSGRSMATSLYPGASAAPPVLQPTEYPSFGMHGEQLMPAYHFPHPPMWSLFPPPPRLPPALDVGLHGSRTEGSRNADTDDMPSRPYHPVSNASPAFLSPGPNQNQNHDALGPIHRFSDYSRRPFHPAMDSSIPPAASLSHPEHVRASIDVSTDHSRHPAHHRRLAFYPEQASSDRTQESFTRRSPSITNPQGHRSDRIDSPRTSTRRSFDRYSFDLFQSLTSSDAEEAAARAPPSSRARHRARPPRPATFGRPPHHDPNIISQRQIQELKDRLPRRLPSELPESISHTCDICQKDYSRTPVEPCEENEVAIELPCGHCFGQFCIFQWFDTCKTHKNKVSCPMCRKQLIEPPRYHPVLISTFSGGGPAFQELFANEYRSELARV